MKQQSDILDGLRTLFRTRWAKYREEFDNARTGSSSESIHALRIATRRLIAILDLLGQSEPALPVRKCMRKLKRNLRMLRDLRDIQVQVQSTSELSARFPQVRFFRQDLLRKEQQLTDAVEDGYSKFCPPGLKRRIRNLKKRLKAVVQNRLFANRYRERAQASLERVYARVLESRKSVDVADLSTIHRLRVRFKKFRYVAETLPGTQQVHLDAMKRYQDAMGGIQDIAVLRRELKAFSDKAGVAVAKRFAPVLEHLDQEQQRSLEAFLLMIDKVQTFRSVTKSAPPAKTNRKRAAKKRKPTKAEPQR